MNRSHVRLFQIRLFCLLLIMFSNSAWGAEPKVQIRSPKDGSHITQEQDYLLVGKVASEAARSPNVDIFLVLDVSGSTPSMQGSISVALIAKSSSARLQVLARSSDGSIGRDTITVHYQPGGMRSLDLEVFLERERI
ncbi:MAG TPA: hypothetical protein VGW77_03125 [Candidatus Binatia bacterium]|jgi:hypothetical protein|nr:hypothetical protein [Candidatus Binatia bacterium]